MALGTVGGVVAAAVVVQGLEFRVWALRVVGFESTSLTHMVVVA